MPAGRTSSSSSSSSKKKLGFWRSKSKSKSATIIETQQQTLLGGPSSLSSSSSPRPPMKTAAQSSIVKEETSGIRRNKSRPPTPLAERPAQQATYPTITHTPSANKVLSYSNPPVLPPTTPSTLPPTPSPRRDDDTPSSWQQADSDMRTKAMRRLHELAQEHSKNVSPDSVPSPFLLSSYGNDKQPRGGGKKDTSYSNNAAGREQKIIDAVLGLHPCVAVETKEMIRGYASKPTSPMTVVNLEKIQKGGNHLFDFAKRSMGKLMNCAADLKDLHEADGLCAWEDGGFKKGDSNGGTGLGHRQYSSDVDDDDDDDDIIVKEDDEVKGVNPTRDPPVSPSHRRHRRRSGLGENYQGSVSSLEEVMGTLDVNKWSPSKVLLPSEHQYHIEDSTRHGGRVVNENKVTTVKERDVERTGKGAYLQLEINGATSGLTSFKLLSEGGAPKHPLSKYELESANPTISNIPFDERSDPYEPVNLYASSKFGDKEIPPRKLYYRPSSENRRNAKSSMGNSLKVQEDWSVCTDEREI